MRRWNLEEENYLKDNYGKIPVENLEIFLKRTKRSIITKANRLGLKGRTKNDFGKINHLKWLKNSKYIILGNYVSSSLPVIHKHITCGYEWPVSPNNIKKLKGCPNCSKKPYSKMALDWIESLNNPNIIHAENGGEYILCGYLVDGFDPTTNTVYEFHGNVWHGNPRIYDPDDRPHPYNNLSAETLFTKTEEKTNKLVSFGYNVIEMWEDIWTSKETK